MTRSGLPDYGMYAALENMGNLVDYGELAARLRSLISFNREGNVIFWDDFESTPLKWTRDKGMGTETVDYSPETALSGGQSIKIETVANINSLARVHRDFPFFHTGKLGFEFAFNHDTTKANLDFDIYHLLDNHQYEARIRLNLEDSELFYRASDGNYVSFASDVSIAKHTHLFHHFKVVIDTGKNEYVRCIMDRAEWNLQGIGLYNWPVVSADYIHLMISLTNINSIIQRVYIDNVILTQNEP